MSSPFRLGMDIVLRGHITDIKFEKYDVDYCYFTLHCIDDVGVEATVSCRVEGMYEVADVKRQKISPGEYVLINGALNLCDHTGGRTYWVDVEGVCASGIRKQLSKPIINYRIAKNNPWFKALNTELVDRAKGVGSRTNV